MFLISETFWVALGSLITASALVYTISQESRRKKEELENIKKALSAEIFLNIKSVFSGKSDRKPLLDVIYKVRTEFVQQIRKQEIFWEIQELYSSLDYWKSCVEYAYHSSNTDEEMKRQRIHNAYLDIAPKCLDFLKESAQVVGATTQNPKIIGVKNPNFEKWRVKIEELVGRMF